MAFYYKINNSEDAFPLYKGFHLQKVKKLAGCGPKISYDFSKHVLIELLDDTTPETELWHELGLTNNNRVIHKRMMVDSHRVKCRRAIVICINADAAKELAHSVSQTKIVNRCVCAVVIEDLLADLSLFEKQIIEFGDGRPQQQLLYVSDLSKSRGPSGLVTFLKETFSPFGNILSVLVCSDDDEYAFPEGVVKFAYLSEAFAAELAFDQYVVGKERLSVTTHHNILLSQCDLRVRLRDAQRCNNFESSVSVESPFQSYIETYGVNNLDVSKEDPVVTTMNNLQIFHANDSITSDDAKHNISEIAFPAYSQCRLNMNLTDVDCSVSTSKDLKKNTNQRSRNIVHSVSTSKKSSESNLNDDEDSHNTAGTAASDILDNVGCKMVKYTSETKLVAAKTLKNVNQIKGSSLYIDSKRGGHPVAKNSTKKRNKFTSSQKLCLKSQRTDLNQSSFQSICSKSSISDPASSQSKTYSDISKPSSKQHSKLIRSIPDTPGPSRITEWLSHLPEHENTTLPYVKSHFLTHENTTLQVKNSVEIDALYKKSKHNKMKQNRISVQRTPSIKPNFFSNQENSLSHNNCVENNDPNRIPMISSSNCVPIPFLHESKSPLQAWLKQEIISSTNNKVIKSQETLKSIIVCAARTKDVMISVGCSNITCDSCYPDSTNLLLGFN